MKEKKKKILICRYFAVTYEYCSGIILNLGHKNVIIQSHLCSYSLISWHTDKKLKDIFLIVAKVQKC